jgi:RIO kinase 1
VHDPLAPLLHDGVVDEIVGRLKSGKEADLWLVRHGGEVVAAKVYKARHVRSFRNDAAYREGRQVRNTRTQRAMDRGSRFGQAAAEDAWKTKESDALHALHAAGVRVPRPIMFYEGVLLMEVVVDAHGHPAPRLVDAPVAREQAAPLYADLRAQAVRMLCKDLVHGDLSPYNVLVGAHGPVIIDFPQVVGAAHNNQAEGFFVRDVENLRRFFASLDPSLHARAGDAREIWRAYARRELHPEFVPSGRAPEGRGPGRAQGERGARSQGDRGQRPPPARGRRAEGERGQRPLGDRGPPQGQRGPQRDGRGAPQGQRGPQREPSGTPPRSAGHAAHAAQGPHGSHAPHAPHPPHGERERSGGGPHPPRTLGGDRRAQGDRRGGPPRNDRPGPPPRRVEGPRRGAPGGGPEVVRVVRLPGVSPAAPASHPGPQGGPHPPRAQHPGTGPGGPPRGGDPGHRRRGRRR